MKKRLLRILLGLVLLPAVPVVLFLVNGLLLAQPGVAQVEGIPERVTLPESREVRILTWNVAKLWLHQGGLNFKPKEDAVVHLERVAAFIREQQPDIVCLQDVMQSCGPSGVDPVNDLSEACGLPVKAFGETYNLGIPGFRVIGGNAILARYPLWPVENLRFEKESPFYRGTGTRRVLVCELEFGEDNVQLASLHLESHRSDKRAQQLKKLLAAIGPKAILAGDWNAECAGEEMRAVWEDDRFGSWVSHAPTFPADQPQRTIDAVALPADWEVLEAQVLSSDLSDHRPVLYRVRLP